jgi:hypothetical protein
VTADCSSPPGSGRKTKRGATPYAQDLGCHPSQAARDSLPDTTFVAIGHSQAVVGDHLVVCNDTDKSISPAPVPAHASKATVITPLPAVKVRRTGCPVHIDDGGLTWGPTRLFAAEINPMASRTRR